MKRFIIYTASLLAIIGFYSMCYYFSFINALERKNTAIREQAPGLFARLTQEDMSINGTSQNRIVKDEPSEAVSFSEEQIVTAETRCIYENHYIDTGEVLTVESGPTADLAGLTRDELQYQLIRYMENLSVREFEAGLISYELVSFSKERVVFRKTYDRSRLEYRFYLSVRNSYVIVYYSDRKTVYEYTGIAITEISEQNRILLMEGLFVKNEEELYDILAALTS